LHSHVYAAPHSVYCGLFPTAIPAFLAKRTGPVFPCPWNWWAGLLARPTLAPLFTGWLAKP
jgi:hypothetical protein